jgi:hypothetical protein
MKPITFNRKPGALDREEKSSGSNVVKILDASCE